MSRFTTCLSLLLVAPFCVALTIPHLTSRTPKHNDPPAVPGNADQGWQLLPDLPEFTTYSDWTLDESKGIKLPLYQSSGKDQSKVKRAVIVLPGKIRDCWYYANSMQNALFIAQDKIGVNLDEVSITSPCFLIQADKDAGAAPEEALSFGSTTWVSGHYSTGPDSVSNYGSYDALDALVAFYMDRSEYPNIESVTVAGHSAGAQMAQRYAALRKTEEDDDRLHFWVANPGSLVWLDSDRPLPDSSCKGFDKYKYGLKSGFPGYASKDVSSRGVPGIVDRYLGRQVHYAWGLKDDGNGDTRCQAMTQGKTHLERGQNFVDALKTLPDTQTVDWVEGVSHDNEAMMDSDAGIEKLFKFL